jgi:patatin-like phospholipase/acyl hydrolase
MKCDPRASLLACTFASPCFGHEPMAKVVTSCLYFYYIGHFKSTLIMTLVGVQNQLSKWTIKCFSQDEKKLNAFK